MHGAFCLADREGLEAQDRQSAAFGQWLVKARGAQGLTQEQAAEKAGVSRIQWARWEAGGGLPKRSNIPAVARAVSWPNESEVYGMAGYLAPPLDWLPQYSGGAATHPRPAAMGPISIQTASTKANI